LRSLNTILPQNNIFLLFLLANVNVIANLDQLEDFTHNLTTLDLSTKFTDKKQYSSEEILALGGILPNVKHLTMGLNNEGFRAVCRGWKSLDSLKITPCSIDEKGFLGIEEGEWFQLPNITDLKRNFA